ncbi:MAG: DctP family TRAP transporter solute-binding subunit [Magnetococcus sp. WYHC-3]
MKQSRSALLSGLLILAGLSLLASLFWDNVLPPPLTDTLAPPVPKHAVQVLRFGHNSPTNSALHKAAERFAREVAQRSGGVLQVRVFPYQELGNDHQMLEMAREGHLDILLTPTAKLGVPLPAMQYADLPFYFPDRQTLYRMLDGEPGQMLLARLQSIGLAGATFWENGFKHFTANRPLRSPRDFQDLRLRVMKSRILHDQSLALGAIPVLTDFHAIRQALADGAADAQENPLVAIVGMGIHHVQKHLTLSEHAYLGYALSFSRLTLARLTHKQQELLMTVAREQTQSEREETQRMEAGFLEAARTAGMTLHTLTPEQRGEFSRALAQLPRRYEHVIGADLLSKTEEWLLLESLPRRASAPILIGLNADLSQAGARAGISLKRGALLAVDEINRAGGLLGRDVALLARDHQSSPGRGLDNMRFFAERNDVVAVLGGMHSHVILEELTQVRSAGLPYLIPWAAAGSVTGNGQDPNWVFRLSVNDDLTGPWLVRRAMERGRIPGLALENSAWGRGVLASMEQELRALSAPAPVVEWVNRGQVNMSDAVSRFSRAGVDVVILVANPPEGAAFAQELATLASPPRVVSHWGITGGHFLELAGSGVSRLNLEFLQTHVPWGSSNPRWQAFQQSYKAYFGLPPLTPETAPSGLGQSYDLVYLLAQAIRQAGTTQRAQVRTALENLASHPGLIKTYTRPFTPRQHDALGEADYHLARYNAEGIIVPSQPLSAEPMP